MTARRRRKRRIGFVVAIVLLIWTAMVIRVNILHPPVPLEIYYQGDTFTYADREITMTGFTMIDGEQTKALLAGTNEEWYRELIETYDSASIRMGLLSLRIRNTRDTAMENGLGGMGWSMMITPMDSLTYCYDDVTEVLNEDALGADWRALAPNEEKDYIVAYFLDSQWISAKQWSRVDTMPYEFILDDYPVEIRISTAIQ